MNFAYKQALLTQYYLRMLSLVKQLAYLFLLPDKVSVTTISVECLDIPRSDISHLPHLQSCS